VSEVSILVPVLGRPHRVAPFLKAMKATVPSSTVLFIADPDDAEELDALEAAGAEFISPGGGYAAKIRAGVEATDENLIFTAADDLLPHDGWFEAAKGHLTDEIQVIGVNDLRPRPNQQDATHFLMTREYAVAPCADGTPGPFYEGYIHNYCDRELVKTAQHRGTYAFAWNAHVEHLHHLDGKAPLDSTYVKGKDSFHVDQQAFRRRSRLWA
jgi:hypothetical protein